MRQTKIGPTKTGTFTADKVTFTLIAMSYNCKAFECLFSYGKPSHCFRFFSLSSWRWRSGSDWQQSGSDFPSDKTAYTLYKDEPRLLSNLDGTPLNQETIALDTTYLFNWGEGKQYKCRAKEIPGKKMFSKHFPNSFATGSKLEYQFHILNHHSFFLDYK